MDRYRRARERASDDLRSRVEASPPSIRTGDSVRVAVPVDENIDPAVVDEGSRPGLGTE